MWFSSLMHPWCVFSFSSNAFFLFLRAFLSDTDSVAIFFLPPSIDGKMQHTFASFFTATVFVNIKKSRDQYGFFAFSPTVNRVAPCLAVTHCTFIDSQLLRGDNLLPSSLCLSIFSSERRTFFRVFLCAIDLRTGHFLFHQFTFF